MGNRNTSKRKPFHPSRPISLAQKRWIFLGTLLGLIILGGAIIFWSRSGAKGLNTAELAKDPSIGPADAKVTIVEYGDFGCTTCKAWFQSGVLEKTIGQYGDQVRFVWRDFPIITAQSPKAAEAGQCAFNQGKFWQYHDLLYQRAPALSVSDLKSYAAEIGLDSAEFDQCLDSGQEKAKVDQSLQEAYQHGFRATPAFLVNNKPLVGPPTFDQLKALIDPILASGG
jgi:protein-disulfide isomerase